MKKNLLKKILKITGIVVLLAVILLSVAIGVIYNRQDRIVQELLETANADFNGLVVIRDSHISPFVNFPYISIDLEDLEIYETKDKAKAPIVSIADTYVGIDVFTLMVGNFEIKSIKLKDGYMRLVQYLDGNLNISNAFESPEPVEEVGKAYHMNLARISLENVVINKWSEETDVTFDLSIANATTRFKTSDIYIKSGLESDFQLTVLRGQDSTFIKNKLFTISTSFDFEKETHEVTFEPTTVGLKNAVFNMSGSIDIDDNARLSLVFEGRKKNFDLLMAFLPTELEPTLNRYANKGDIYFNASVEGPCINGNDPFFIAEFGCEDGYFDNVTTQKKLDDLEFTGYFTNGSKRTPETMEFAIQSFRARPEAGIFSGSLVVKNFDSPDIDMQLDSDFDLDFLAKFFNVEQLQDLRGHVLLKMNFHDIIDLDRPELSIEKLNESYYTELEVKGLGFRSPDFHLPVSDINIRAKMDGHKAHINEFSFKAGRSDMRLSGSVDDLPAIMHHTNIPVNARLKINSDRLDLFELTSGDTAVSKAFDEVLTDLNLDLRFLASARDFTEFTNLPVGEFFIDDLDMTMKNYPHRLHDFTADIVIDKEDFSIIDFSGEVDDSDFHFTGKLTHYDLWFAENPIGDTRIEYDLVSKLIRLEDLFSYGGENYMPEDYRHEELRDLAVKGRAELHFIDSLHSTDLYLDHLTGKMKMHKMKLERFGGRFHFEDERLTVTNFRGAMGNSSFAADLAIDLRTMNEGKEHANTLNFRAKHLDFDQLFAWEEPPSTDTTQVDHDDVFSVFDIPFPNLKVDLDIERMTYHKYKIENLKGGLRTTKDHKLYFDELGLEIAGGSILANGYFSGEDREKIYLYPMVAYNNIDIDQLLLKFDNFGQDAIVAENLHGFISGTMTGTIHVHADLVPIIDDSEIHLDLEVIKGRLDNYEPMLALADYFQDKDLNRVHFDTLKNKLDIVNGVTTIPRMRINSSLGFMEISGKQDLDMNMDYIIRVPWKMVTGAGSQRLFGSKKKADVEQDDAIIQEDPKRKTRFVNVRMTGTPDDFKISLVGKKKATAGL